MQRLRNQRTSYSNQEKKKLRLRLPFFIVLAIIVFGFGLVYFFTRTPPAISFHVGQLPPSFILEEASTNQEKEIIKSFQLPDPSVLNSQTKFFVTVKSPGVDLCELEVTAINQQNSEQKETWVWQKEQSKTSSLKLVSEMRSKSQDRKQNIYPFEITKNILGLAFKNKPFTIKAYAKQCRFLRSKATYQSNYTGDFDLPILADITESLYLNQGGAGLIKITANESVKAKAKVGRFQFPLTFDPVQKNYFGFIAHPFDVAKALPIEIVAKDKAGNIQKLVIQPTFFKKQFRNRRINISSSFIKNKIQPLLVAENLTSQSETQDFLKINDMLRERNAAAIKEISQKSQNKKLWQGSFMRMPGKTEAFFADKRDYFIANKKVDQQYHLGVDIAGVAQNPVPAAQDGVVLFANNLGIYGQTVIIDHGLGLVSLYSHLSQIKVKQDNPIKKGDIIGNTGKTGLAGGDHLHFSLYIYGHPTNPLEFWDDKWIREKIEDKLK